ncbi:hypothetical protein OE88DRAFT_1659160 [Heliocybe sulcata]|uniref:Uncharacterized protein n=1 Tax=Heliocybe sulcata TaxID=5364 RepID=A0A5C3N561_9AGAM|nr:hypothetical protein OE88DRAFT_1659160 [Heliocybe sulcata]
MGTVYVLSIRAPKAPAVIIGDVTLCNLRISSSLVPAILFEVVLALIILYRAMLHVRSRRDAGIPPSRGYGSRLLITLVRDSIQYYICNIAICVLAAVGSKTPGASTGLALVMFSWVVVLPTASVTSMILHLYQISGDGYDYTSQPDPSTLLDTAIQFAAPDLEAGQERSVICSAPEVEGQERRPSYSTREGSV